MRLLPHPDKCSLHILLCWFGIGLVGNFLPPLTHLLVLFVREDMRWTDLRLWLFCFERDQLALDLVQLHFELVEGVGRAVVFKPFQLRV